MAAAAIPRTVDPWRDLDSSLVIQPRIGEGRIEDARAPIYARVWGCEDCRLPARG